MSFQALFTSGVETDQVGSGSLIEYNAFIPPCPTNSATAPGLSMEFYGPVRNTQQLLSIQVCPAVQGSTSADLMISKVTGSFTLGAGSAIPLLSAPVVISGGDYSVTVSTLIASAALQTLAVGDRLAFVRAGGAAANAWATGATACLSIQLARL